MGINRRQRTSHSVPSKSAASSLSPSKYHSEELRKRRRSWKIPITFVLILSLIYLWSARFHLVAVTHSEMKPVVVAPSPLLLPPKQEAIQVQSHGRGVSR